MNRYYYAVEWPYGRACDAITGRPIFDLHRFHSKRARDEWVEDGNPYTTQKGHREARLANDPDIRRLLDSARHRIAVNRDNCWDPVFVHH